MSHTIQSHSPDRLDTMRRSERPVSTGEAFFFGALLILPVVLLLVLSLASS